jgi:hypothetical protein
MVANSLRYLPEILKTSLTHVKGHCHEIFHLRFFVKLPLLVPINMSRNDFNFFKIFKQLFNNFDNGKAYCAGVVDTIGEFLSGVNDTGQ